MSRLDSHRSDGRRPLKQEPTSGNALPLEQRMKRVVAESLEISPEDLELSTPLLGGEVGLDSFSALRLLTAVEEEFGVYIDDDSFHVLETISSLMAFVRANEKGS